MLKRGAPPNDNAPVCNNAAVSSATQNASVCDSVPVSSSTSTQSTGVTHNTFTKMKFTLHSLHYRNSLLKSKLKKANFGIHSLKSDSLVKSYTGFPTKSVMNVIFSQLKKKGSRQQYLLLERTTETQQTCKSSI